MAALAGKPLESVGVAAAREFPDGCLSRECIAGKKQGIGKPEGSVEQVPGASDHWQMVGYGVAG